MRMSYLINNFIGDRWIMSFACKGKGKKSGKGKGKK